MQLSSDGTRAKEPPVLVHRNWDTVRSFFSWFSQYHLPEADKVAQIIKEDSWPKPLRYYLLGDGCPANPRWSQQRPSKVAHRAPSYVLQYRFQSG